MNVIAKKFVTATIAALSIGATIALSAAPAEAKFGRKGAFFGGLAVGLLGAGIASHRAYGHHYGYRHRCWTEKRPRYNRWGDFRGYRYIRICR